MNRHFILVAGEASGDILGARLIQSLKQHYPEATFSGIGGSLMIAEGFKSYFPMERLSIMGVVPILKKLPGLLKMRRQLTRMIIQANPVCFIGIDAPVFNTELEYQLKNKGIKTVHYVSPSVWAWRENRIYKIAKSVSLMLCLFPFELDIYKRHSVPAICIGHPLANEIPMEPNIQTAREELNLELKTLTVAILPGSRGTEVKYLIEPFLETAKKFYQRYPEVQFIIPCANQKRREQIERAIKLYNFDIPLRLIDGVSRTVMQASDIVLLASGTATLEAMLLKKPMLVAYKVSAFSFWIYKNLLKIKQFSLPNLLAGEPIVKELIQEHCNVELLYQELVNLVENKEATTMIDKFHQLHKSLMLGGSDKAAKAIVDMLEEHGV